MSSSKFMSSKLLSSNWIVRFVFLALACLVLNLYLFSNTNTYSNDFKSQHNSPGSSNFVSSELHIELVTKLAAENDDLKGKVIELKSQLRAKGNLKAADYQDEQESAQIPEMNDLNSFKDLRVYCMVPTMYSERKFASWRAILRTWGHRCTVLKFFVDPIYVDDLQLFSESLQQTISEYQSAHDLSQAEVVELYSGNERIKKKRIHLPKYYFDDKSGRFAEIVVVDMKRLNDQTNEDGKYIQQNCWAGGAKNKDGTVKYTACRHIWEKVWRSWVYMKDNDINTADYFFKVDDDTFFFPDFVKKHAFDHGWSADDTHYFGHHLHHGKVKTGFIAGAAVGYSRKTLELAAEKYKQMANEYGDRTKFKHGQCVDRDGATQEVTESICLDQLNIHAEDTRDLNGLEKTTLHSLSESMLLRKREETSYWFWQKKENTAVCCSVQPIAFHHYKKGEMLEKMDNLLFNRNERSVIEAFSEYDRTHSLKDKPMTAATNLGKLSEKLFTSGTALGKFLEFEYMLHVREMLDVNDLFDESYDL